MQSRWHSQARCLFEHKRLTSRHPSNRSCQDTPGLIKRISTAMYSLAQLRSFTRAPSAVSIPRLKRHPPANTCTAAPWPSAILSFYGNAISRSYYRYRACLPHTIEIADTFMIARITTAPVLRRSGPLPADFRKKLPLFRYELSP